MVEKPGAQKITVCKNQGKQREREGSLKKNKLFFKKNDRR